MTFIQISAEPIKTADLYQRLIQPQFGGIVTFTGTVREWTGEIQTQYLEYTAYEAMAKKEMAKLAAEVLASVPAEIVMVHRVGHLELMDTAVYIGVATAHRKDAFKWCEYLIDQVKAQVPIWKKEVDFDKTRWGGLNDDAN